MNTKDIRTLIAGLGLTIPATTTGCGDPCLDDGYGQIGANCAEAEAEPAADSGMDPGPIEAPAVWTCYRDADGDGFGDPADAADFETDACGAGYVPGDAPDCDDTNPNTFPGAAELEDGAACMNDDDGDGWGDPNPPAGVNPGTDCDDQSSTTYPGAAANESPSACMSDEDGDGWGDDDPLPGVEPGRDCADRDPDLWACNTLWCIDADGDGFGDPDNCTPGGDTPPEDGWVDNDDDCLDSDANARPGAASREPRLCAVDSDGDGWGDDDPPEGVDAGTDCVSDHPGIFPGAAANEPALCTIDADSDGWGDDEASQIDPLADNGTDCADDDGTIHPQAASAEPALCTTDADGDGFGPATPPPGAEAGTDCDDASVFTFPGASENETPPLDAACTRDADEDGFGDQTVEGGPVQAGTDCNDASAQTFPGAAELENPDACMADEDFDGYGESDPPEGVVAGQDCEDADMAITICGQYCHDGDGDGFGDPGDCTLANAAPGPDWVPNDTDCLPADATVYPGAAEHEPALCTADDDDDGWGDAQPPAGADAGTDCADDNVAVFPGAAANEPALCTLDADGDGFGDASAGAMGPLVEDGTDCDDASDQIFPGAAANEPALCTLDGDGDGFGPSAPPPGADAGTDCDDASIFAFPGAAENELPPLNAQCTLDADDDGFGDINVAGPIVAGTDCNDASDQTFPGAAEIENPILCMADLDQDGYGESSPLPGVAPGQDCADGNPLVTVCGIWCFDADGDGFGDPANCAFSEGPPGMQWVANDIDCMDNNPNAFPGAAVNEPGLCTIDVDGDGFGPSTPPLGLDAGADCDDSSALAFPGASPLELPPLNTACTIDGDGDGFGDGSPLGGIIGGSDCADDNPNAFPGASENEAGALATACTLDADQDGFGDTTPPLGIVPGNDCDDAVDTTYPGAAEAESPLLCMADADEDGYGSSAPPLGVVPGQDCVDNDPGVTVCNMWCLDGDGDGFGGDTCVIAAIAPGLGWVGNDTDCADGDPNTYPGAAQLEPALCAADADDDGWGDSTPPPGADAGSDCDDSTAAAQPGAAPLDDPSACMIDLDGDDYGDSTPPAGVTPGSDCNDAQAQAYPGAAQLEPALCAMDVDDDGYGDSTPPAGVDAGSDCADTLADAYPGAAQLEPALCAIDADDDGYGDDSPPAGIDPGVDCDDSNASTYPGSAENDDAFGCLQDEDGDGYGAIDPPPGVTPGVDCDDTDPGFADCTCLSPLEYTTCDGTPEAPTNNVLEAIGIDCSADPTESMVITNATSAVNDVRAWSIAHQYGSANDPSNPGFGLWSPRPDAVNPDAQHNAGNNLLILSTGQIGPSDASGILLEPAGSQDHPTTNPQGGYPSPLVANIGSNGGMGGTPFENCDGTNDCSDTLQALGLDGIGLFDQVFFQVEFQVPEGVDGFRFDFAYFSAEYPDWVNTAFNDIFVVWVESAAFTGNVAVTPDGTPFTITELTNSGEMLYLDADPGLAGTGFEGHAGTGWRSVLAPVVPGETLRVSFFLADAGDQFLNTVALIDNFRWDCAGCEGVGDCGLTTLP